MLDKELDRDLVERTIPDARTGRNGETPDISFLIR